MKLVEAFNEIKSLKEWSQDSRCKVSYTVLKNRLRYGWKVEDALRGPRYNVVKGKKRKYRERKYIYEYEGKEMSIEELANLPNCVVGLKVLKSRLYAGWDIKSSLTLPRGSVCSHKSETYTAFGDIKSFNKWMKDSRCVVSYQIVKKRLKEGYDFEKAISERVVKKGVRAWGEIKTISEWSKDPRCIVSRTSLLYRIRRGMKPEDAITVPNQIGIPYDNKYMKGSDNK